MITWGAGQQMDDDELEEMYARHLRERANETKTTNRREVWDYLLDVAIVCIVAAAMYAFVELWR